MVPTEALIFPKTLKSCKNMRKMKNIFAQIYLFGENASF